MKKSKPTPAQVVEAGSWGIWGKEPSEFPWSYPEKETCLILEGSATVISAAGDRLDFETGDLVEFEAGLECTWKIHDSIKKRFKFGE